MADKIQIYVTDFGDVRLPDDFPMHNLRKDGLPDRRRRYAERIKQYFEDLEVSAAAEWMGGKSVRDMKLMSFHKWASSHLEAGAL